MQLTTDVAVRYCLRFSSDCLTVLHFAREDRDTCTVSGLATRSLRGIEPLHMEYQTVRMHRADRPVRTWPDPQPTQWHLIQVYGGVNRRA